ncbi:synaptic vesicle glycoprotein 2A [Anabrus simplex]|uniref:synaptic vesicle glycoprotein 2A n=1 Tax=Anabrus simplex TaxID=316456 RepID=UPI0035A36CBF
MVSAVVDNARVFGAQLHRFTIRTPEPAASMTMENGGPAVRRDASARTLYEEAITLAGHGKFHWWLILSNALALLVLSVECDLMPYVLPGIDCDFNITSTEKGIHNAIVYIGMICGCHFWSFIADTTGRRRVIMVALFLDLCSTLISAFMPTFVSFITLRFFSGFCISGLSVSNAYLGEFHSEKTKTKALLWMCIALPVASALMPGLAMIVIPQPWSVPLPWMNFTSWRFLTLICIIPPLLTLALFWYLPESPKLLLALDKDEEALEVLRNIYAMNTGCRPEEYPVKSVLLESQEVNEMDDMRDKRKARSAGDVAMHMVYCTKQLFVPPYLICTVLTCVIQFGVMFTYAGFYTWLPDLLNRMAEFYNTFPNKTATFCGAIMELEQFSKDLYVTSTEPFVVKRLMSTLSNVSAAGNIGKNRVFLNRTIDMNNTAVNLTSLLYTVVNGTSDDSAPVNMTRNGAVALNVTGYSLDNMKALSPQCPGGFDEKAIMDTLFIAVASAVAYIFVGHIVRFISKKWILVFTLLLSGACAVAMHFTTIPVLITILPGIIIVVSSIGYSVVNAVVVDYFPTQLRAMAVGMSLSSGRLGEVVCSVMLGYLIQERCVLFVFLFGGICVACGVTSFLLPKKS